MANLTFRHRWATCVPDVLGNRDETHPFTVKVRRLSRAELDRFIEQAHEVRSAGGGNLDLDAMVELFDGVVRGPFGQLAVDGEPIAEGDLRALLELAAQEFPWVGCIFDGLVEAVVLVNELSEASEGNFARRRGGHGSTEPATAAAASPRPEDAPSADASSSPESTSSDSMATASPG